MFHHPPVAVRRALWLAALCAVLLAGRVHADEVQVQPCTPIRVVDGDTIVCAVDGAPVKVRVVGVDTPERVARCPAERAAAERATAATSALVFSGRLVELVGRPTATDRYGRRLARVRIGGQDLAGLLIADGLGVPYAGARRKNWCAAPAVAAPSSPAW